MRKKEKRFLGIPAAPGIAIGQAVVLSKETVDVPHLTISPDEVDREIERLRRAIESTRSELFDIKKRVLHRLGERDASLFDAHIMILDDAVVIDQAIDKIRSERCNAEWAYFQVMRSFHDTLQESDDAHLKERAVDILDVKRRVLRHLAGEESCLVSPERGLRIVVAHQLTPSQTVLLDRNAVLAFAVDLGGQTSHVAILAKGLEKPAVVGLKHFAQHVEDGDRLIVDGNLGLVILNPTKNTLLEYRKLQERYHHFLQDLIPVKKLPARTLDGHLVQIGANIELPEEVESALLNGAEGIGLFRTEYLFLSKSEFPSEEEQYKEYKRVVDSLYPNSVIIRTFDLGGDRFMMKNIHVEEQNPFLGWRSIRVSLDMPDQFKTQLRAILRSSDRQTVRVMFPMISSVEEVLQSKQLLEEAKAELKREGREFDEHLEVGIMVEVPAAAMIMEKLVQYVDFVSIGTNDLIQYTLAVDRGNERIAHLYTNYHPAVLRLIHRTVIEGHKQNIWVGLCGEMASDPLIVPFLIGIGLDELSMTPTMIPEIKKLIRSLRFNSTKRLQEDVLECKTSREVKEVLTNFFRKELPELYEVLLSQESKIQTAEREES